MSSRTRTAPSPWRMRLVAGNEDDRRAAFARDVTRGLTRADKRLSARWLLDEVGVDLLRRLRQQPTSYMLAAERQVIGERAYTVPLYFPRGRPRIIEIGVLDTKRTKALLAPLLEAFGALRYTAVGPHRRALEEPCRELGKAFSDLDVTAVLGHAEDAVRELRADAAPALLFWPGGGLGDHARAESILMLRGVAAALRPSDLLIATVDLRKDARVVQRVYRDRQGITKQLHLHILERINDELGGHFDVSLFRHRFSYDEETGELDSHIVSRRAQTVRIDALDLDVACGKGEMIHTLTVTKFSPLEIDHAAYASELTVHERWYDREGRVCANLMRPKAR